MECVVGWMGDGFRCRRRRRRRSVAMTTTGVGVAETLLRGLDRRTRRSLVGLGNGDDDDDDVGVGVGTAAVGRRVVDDDGGRRAACVRHAFGDVDWRSRCAGGASTSRGEDASSSSSSSSYVERLRASAAFASGATTRLMCAAFGAHGSISRVNPRLASTRRIRDEAGRAKAMGEIRGNCKWAWAKESACQGALATRAERYEEAEKCFEQALGLDPKHVRAYVGRGACYANQRKYAAALKDFDRALEIVPDDERAMSYKAAVTEKMEKVSRARDDWSTRGGPVARKEDVDSLRARVLNPARGLEALRRGETTNKSYDLELGDDDDNDDGKDRRSDGKRKRYKEKRRKKDRKSDRRGRSDHRSSRKSSKRSRRGASSSSSSSYGSPARRK